jgi:hypothetical protein
MRSHHRRSLACLAAAALVAALLAAPAATAVATGSPPVLVGATLDALFARGEPYSVPIGGAVFRGGAPTFNIRFRHPGGALDPGRTGLWIDGRPVTDATLADTCLSATVRLDAGRHVAKVVVTQADSEVATASYAFTIASPKLQATRQSVSRDPSDPSLLHVRWLFRNVGTAQVWETRVRFTATRGAVYLGDANLMDGPSFVYSLAPGSSKTAETLFRVPPGARSFRVGYEYLYGGGAGGVLDETLESHPLFGPAGDPSGGWCVTVPPVVPAGRTRHGR